MLKWVLRLDSRRVCLRRDSTSGKEKRQLFGVVSSWSGSFFPSMTCLSVILLAAALRLQPLSSDPSDLSHHAPPRIVFQPNIPNPGDVSFCPWEPLACPSAQRPHSAYAPPRLRIIHGRVHAAPSVSRLISFLFSVMVAHCFPSDSSFPPACQFPLRFRSTHRH